MRSTTTLLDLEWHLISRPSIFSIQKQIFTQQCYDPSLPTDCRYHKKLLTPIVTQLYGKESCKQKSCDSLGEFRVDRHLAK